jgi:hypothetical protein
MQMATFVLAVWGAMLSTTLAVVALQRERRRLKVEVFFGHHKAEGMSMTQPTLTLRCVNTGSRALRISDASIVWESGDLVMPLLSDSLPAKLEADEHVDVVLTLGLGLETGADSGLVPLTASVTYNEGRQSVFAFSERERELARALLAGVARGREVHLGTTIHLPRAPRRRVSLRRR